MFLQSSDIKVVISCYFLPTTVLSVMHLTEDSLNTVYSFKKPNIRLTSCDLAAGSILPYSLGVTYLVALTAFASSLETDQA